MDHVAALLLGLGNGGVFAALALALVTTYRASGVINFATGAVALYVAYTYAGLRRGELLVPFPGLRRLGVRYGGVIAVADVSLQVDRGEIVGLIGPNGAGKTSVIDAVTGFAPATGSVRLGDTTESRWLGERIRDIAWSGTAVLLVDHDVALVLGVCAHVYVLDFGNVIAEGPPDVIRADRAVADAYLGGVPDAAVLA